ncbi:DEAD/DEAH box helicase [Microbacterium horticulturae]|uniref:DEAD/DEAH box helicase n=1 Tax=Microbacterium horticulturae TaxID=3028316 RepID=A0ABY8C232_9MICO|nr:DEAD/DEAH box helicase [Microbacterium sp. KACC 23027]WEG10510.1 DEAD/DEAH box helicase [Microbacterium sp. KACC 23027]
MPALHLDPDDIRRRAEGYGFERGVTYFRTGAVRHVSWEEDAGVLTGIVDGSRSATYRTRVQLDFARPGSPIVSTACSCPMQAGCKHVVATLLAWNAQTMGATLPPASAPPAPVPIVIPPVETGPVPSPRNSAREPTWRSILAPAPRLHGTRSLALGVELRQRAARGHSRWAPARWVTATARSLATAPVGPEELSLSLRPLERSASTGRWIKGQMSWDALRRTGVGYDARQVAWLRELHSIARAPWSFGGYANTGDWITLDEVTSSLLWPHLAGAAAHEIELVPTVKSQTVRLAASGEVTVRIAPVAAALTLTTQLSIDGAVVEPDGVRAIGDTGVYAYASHRSQVEITLAPAALSDSVRALLQTREGIVVPAAEREQFLREGYPKLVRHAPVMTEDVALPEPEPTRLELMVRFRPRDTIDYVLEWIYPGGVQYPYGWDDAPERDADGERPLRAAVTDAWSEAAASGTLLDIEAAEFIATVLPRLREIDHLQVVTKGKQRTYRELEGDPEIAVSTVESTDPDWFDLGVMVTIDGRHIPFQPLFSALARRQGKLLLSDGGYFSLKHPALDRLRELIEESAELNEWETAPRINRYQTALWADFEDLADVSEPAVSWRATAEGLRDVAQVEQTTLPTALHAELRPYQKAGYDWLAFLWRHRLGGILADDMGLGKTLQTLALIAHTREAGEQRPVLVVAPTSVLATWRDEASRFAPDLNVAVVDATRSRRGALPDDLDVVITSYTLLRLDEDEFAARDWALVVLDEAQFVKNPATKLHKAVKSLRADAVFALTGTPMENTLAELWALLSLTAPGLFPSARRFREEYVGPIEKGKVPENQEGGPYRAARLKRLRHRIRPLMLRRTKELVAADLPAKQEQQLWVELAPAHRALYDTVLQRERQKVLGLLEDLDRNRFIVFRSLTLLRMLALAPVLVDPAHARIPSAKLDDLVEQIAELAAEGHRCLVFSQFTSFLQLAAERLDAAGIATEYLDGSTRRRADVIDAFRQGEAPVFLISLKAGGFGLTLTEADYVFLLDPWWNPAAEAQAVDRTHRIGQTRSVFVYRMIATGTIEEKVLALQQRKARLFRSVMDDDDLFAKALSADDIRGLFED